MTRLRGLGRASAWLPVVVLALGVTGPAARSALAAQAGPTTQPPQPTPAPQPAQARPSQPAPARLAPPAPARPAPTSAPLPPARPVDAILADAIKGLGGAAAIGRHRSLHTKMEITFSGLGITGTGEHYAAAGDKVLSTMSIPNLASTREGGDGTHFWSDDPINGLRILEGPEAEQARVEAAWNAELRTKELFPKIEAKNERSDDGVVLECLTLTPKTGAAMTDCYDPTTHLLMVQRGVRNGPQGDMPFSAKLKDWRLVTDVKVAFLTEMQVGPLAFVGRLISVELDVPVDAALFAVPSAPAKGGAGGASGKGKAKPVKRTRAGKVMAPSAPQTPGASTTAPAPTPASAPASAPTPAR